MTAKEQYEYYNSFVQEARTEFDKGMVKFLLRQPIPMSYEVWSYLHNIIEKEI